MGTEYKQIIPRTGNTNGSEIYGMMLNSLIIKETHLKLVGKQ